MTEEIPFVPAYDLLEAAERKLKDSEVAAIALALRLLCSKETEAFPETKGWSRSARVEGVSQRL